MTTPAPPPRPRPEERALVELEEQTSNTVRDLVAAAIAAGLTAAALAALRDAVTGVVRDAVRRAVRLGIAMAVRVGRAGRGRARRRRPTRRPLRVPPTARLEAAAAREIQEAVTQIREDARTASEREISQRAAARLGAIAATAVNQAASAGVDATAQRIGADGIMWIAERDACLTCTALSGHIVKPGERFPTHRTYGDKPLIWRGFTGRPPRHPHCRCRVRPVWGDAQGAAAALRREARRSVVRGFSLPSESEAARLRAAARLLRRGAGLPQTVEEYGWEAVRQGRFPRGRAVPTGAGRRPR